MHFRKAHKRLNSGAEQIFDDAQPTPIPERRATFRSRPGQKSIWRRLLRSCVASSNPDVVDQQARPPQEASQLVDIQQKTKRASYIPRHADTSFANTTTPLQARDAERRMRHSRIYQQAFVQDGTTGSKMKATTIGLSFTPEEDEGEGGRDTKKTV